ncbi:MAG: glycosyltransferase family 4 protein [Bacteroidetes bacterium]|nr:glycosyltransferase family 4 protein [Bacteroidota bacterium]
MNIAILLLNQGRGSGEVAREHVRHLIKMGHKVFFLYPGNNNEIKGAENINVQLHTQIIPVHEYLPSAGDKQKQVARMNHEEMLEYLVDYENALRKIAHDVDIFIAHHANLSCVAVHNIAKEINKPYVVFVHGTGIEPRYEKLWDDANWRMIKNAIIEAKGVLVTTEYVRDILVKPIIDIPNNKFLILPCGVDLEDFRPDNIEGIREKFDLPETYVICPGALTKSKGPQNVVEASSEYSDLALSVFIGAGELQEELEKKLGEKGKFLGFVSSEDKAKLINAATLLVAAPEKKEHFGIIYAEALAGGTPCVAYKGGGVGSIVTSTEGILTERNPESLGKKINYLLQNSGLRRQMAVSCRARAEKLYNYNELVQELVDWLQPMCK